MMTMMLMLMLMMVVAGRWQSVVGFLGRRWRAMDDLLWGVRRRLAQQYLQKQVRA